MAEDGPSVACLPFGVGRRMKGATRMNLDIAYCHFRSIGAAAGGGIATLAQSDGRMEAYFLEYTQNFVITSRKDLAPSSCINHCFQELISNLIQLLLGNCVLMLLCLVSGQRLLSVCVCGMTLACVGTVYIAGSRDPICYEEFKA